METAPSPQEQVCLCVCMDVSTLLDDSDPKMDPGRIVMSGCRCAKWTYVDMQSTQVDQKLHPRSRGSAVLPPLVRLPLEQRAGLPCRGGASSGLRGSSDMATQVWSRPSSRSRGV